MLFKVLLLISLLTNTFGCSDCNCIQITTTCCNNICDSTTNNYDCPSESPSILPTISPSVLPTLTPTTSPTLIPTNSPSNTPTVSPSLICDCSNYLSDLTDSIVSYEVTGPVESDSYVLSTIITANGKIYSDVSTYCIDYLSITYSNTIYNDTIIYPYNHLTSSSHPINLNQTTWLINHIKVGDTAIGSYNSILCNVITASDIQSAIWYIVEPTGTCNNFDSLCTKSLYDVNVCNVKYIVDTVLTALPIGSPYNPTSDSIKPLVVYPSYGDKTDSQTMIIYSPTICSCECIDNKIVKLSNTEIVDVSFSSPLALTSYVESDITVDGKTFSHVSTFCVDYTDIVFSYTSYNQTKIYSYTEVINQPSLAPRISDTNGLNQVAWILNNLLVGSVIPYDSYTYNSITYTDCNSITVSDIQASIWSFVSSGCDFPSNVCEETLSTVNYCNVAYILSTTLSNIPIGERYDVSTSTCTFTYPIIPYILIPDDVSNKITFQNMIIAVESSCPCLA